MGKSRTIRPYERKPRVCEWNRDRLLQLIDFFDGIPGGELEISLAQLIDAVGIPEASLKRHLDWAKRYGIIEVTASAEFGKGRLPNRYTLVLGREAWEQHGPAIVARYQAEAEPVRWATSDVRAAAQTPAPPGEAGSAWLNVK